MAQLLNAAGAPISKSEVARARAQANASGFANAYDAAESNGPWLSGWRPGITSPDAEWLPNRDVSVARARDLARNDPLAAAAISRRKNSVVGRGWRFSSKPNARALGISFEQARELAGQIESEFGMYAYGHAFESDAERKMTFGQQLRLAAHQLMADGEFLAVAEWAENEPTRYRTRLRMVDPDRLSNPNGRSNDATWRGGIEHDAAGVPQRYWIRERHPADFNGASLGALSWAGFERFTEWGRPQVFHGFDAERAGQSRGVTRFAAVLKSFRALSRFTDATLQTATINALFAAFVQSSAGPEAVSESLTAKELSEFEKDREAFYDQNPVVLGGDARIPVLPLGDEIKMATASRDVTSFDAFVRAVIRLIASALGVTYEEISMDYSQTNYSSARAALIHAAAEISAMFGVLMAQLANPFLVAWLEEAIDRGRVILPPGAPSFYDAIDAYAAGKWIGPKRDYIDPTKEILAMAARIEAGVSTLEDECAEQGKDWEEVAEQRAREEAKYAELGIAVGAPGKTRPAAATPAEPAEDEVAPEDKRPPAPKAGRSANVFRRAGSALARIAGFADTAEHREFLDARR